MGALFGDIQIRCSNNLVYERNFEINRREKIRNLKKCPLVLYSVMQNFNVRNWSNHFLDKYLLVNTKND